MSLGTDTFYKCVPLEPAALELFESSPSKYYPQPNPSLQNSYLPGAWYCNLFNVTWELHMLSLLLGTTSLSSPLSLFTFEFILPILNELSFSIHKNSLSSLSIHNPPSYTPTAFTFTYPYLNIHHLYLNMKLNQQESKNIQGSDILADIKDLVLFPSQVPVGSSPPSCTAAALSTVTLNCCACTPRVNHVVKYPSCVILFMQEMKVRRSCSARIKQLALCLQEQMKSLPLTDRDLYVYLIT